MIFLPPYALAADVKNLFHVGDSNLGSLDCESLMFPLSYAARAHSQALCPNMSYVPPHPTSEQNIRCIVET